MRQSRVYTCVHVPTRKTNPSFGGEFSAAINVGSSSTYSNRLANVTVDETQLVAPDWSAFRLWVDGEVLKLGAFNNKTKAFVQLPPKFPLIRYTNVDLAKLLEELAR